ncbi:hypothetical protein ACXR6G_16295 [Ancylomarina sp. YFZ004]
MEKHNVPQDNINLFNEKLDELQYALDSNGNYVQVKSVGWEPKNIAMRQAWEEVDDKIKIAIEAVKNEEKSPIFYYMHKNIMNIKILAEYTGMYSWTIKRHMKPKNFTKLSDKKLEAYREAFNLLTIDELKSFNINLIIEVNDKL